MLTGAAELADFAERRNRFLGFLSRLVREKPLGTFGLAVTLAMIRNGNLRGLAGALPIL